MNFSPSKKILITSIFVIWLAGLLLCGSCFFGYTQSFADNSSGDITINGQSGVNYDGYKVFDATIGYVEKDSKSVEEATEIDWPSDNMKEVTLSFIRANGYTNESDFAPDALYYIKTQIENDGVTTHSVSDYFSYKFAKELVQNNKINADANIDSGVKITLDQGYWLFTSPESLDLDKIATCPIWTSVAAGEKVVSEKASSNVPALAKRIINNDGSQVNAWDGRVGEEIEYEICGTLPSNFSSFPTYRYIITDNLSSNLEPVINEEGQLDYTLKDQNGNPYTPDVMNLDKADNKIEIGFYDINKVAGITSDTVFIFSYKAKIVPGTVAGPNDNNAILTYTVNPVTSTTATSVATLDSSANVYTFNLIVHVVDANSEKGTEPGLGLAGAKFGVKVGEEQFIQADGSVGPVSHLFETDSDGIINIPGLSSGKYTFVQEYTPEGYVLQENDVDITIKPTFDSYSLSKLEGDLKGGYIHPLIGSKWHDDKIINIDPDECLMEARICNLHQSNVLPVTGLSGYIFIGIIALVFLSASCFGIHKVRVKSKKINNQ